MNAQIFAIDGNIGSGKSTFIEELEKKYYPNNKFNDKQIIFLRG